MAGASALIQKDTTSTRSSPLNDFSKGLTPDRNSLDVRYNALKDAKSSASAERRINAVKELVGDREFLIDVARWSEYADARVAAVHELKNDIEALFDLLAWNRHEDVKNAICHIFEELFKKSDGRIILVGADAMLKELSDKILLFLVFNSKDRQTTLDAVDRLDGNRQALVEILKTPPSEEICNMASKLLTKRGR